MFVTEKIFLSQFPTQTNKITRNISLDDSHIFFAVHDPHLCNSAIYIICELTLKPRKTSSHKGRTTTANTTHNKYSILLSILIKKK